MTDVGLFEGGLPVSLAPPTFDPLRPDADLPFTVVEWGRDWAGRLFPVTVELDDGSVVPVDVALELLGPDAEEALRRFAEDQLGGELSVPDDATDDVVRAGFEERARRARESGRRESDRRVDVPEVSSFPDPADPTAGAEEVLAQYAREHLGGATAVPDETTSDIVRAGYEERARRIREPAERAPAAANGDSWLQRINPFPGDGDMIRPLTGEDLRLINPIVPEGYDERRRPYDESWDSLTTQEWEAAYQPTPSDALSTPPEPQGATQDYGANAAMEEILARALRRLEGVPREFHFDVDLGIVGELQDELLDYMERGDDYVQEVFGRSQAIQQNLLEDANKIGGTVTRADRLAEYSSFLHDPYIQEQAKLMGITADEYEANRHVIVGRLADIDDEVDSLRAEWAEFGDDYFDDTKLRVVQEEYENKMMSEDYAALDEQHRLSAEDRRLALEEFNAEVTAADTQLSLQIAQWESYSGGGV